MRFYILDGTVTKEVGLDEWNSWRCGRSLEDDCIAYDRVYGTEVRTWFVGYDEQGDDRIFATRARDQKGCILRAKTWDEAERFHRWECERIESEYKLELLRKARTRRL
jgi:hypothetical protein